MNEKTMQHRRAGWRTLAGFCFVLAAGQAAIAQAQTTVTSVRMSPGGERTDRLVIEFSGREPDLAVAESGGALVVTLGGAKLADSVVGSQAGGASLGVIRGTEATAHGAGVELKVQTRVKAWSHSAMQTRRNIVIDFVAAAVQPPDDPVPVPVPVPVLAAPIAAAPVLAASAADAAPAEETSLRRREKAKECVECHEAFYSITKTKHYVRSDSRTPGSQGAENSPAECQACHGDLTAHQKTPRVKGLVPITYGKKSPALPQNEQCLSCHQGGTRIHWQGSAHDRAQQTCSGCHRMHAPKDPVLVTETQASVCFDCHKDRRAEMHRLSTHPTKTGFVTCSSCHASHGSSARASLQKNSVNETCYTCHAQLRGPFLWEHRPAQDDCTHCHNPHGTNNPPMLKVRQPFLCQQCHMTVGHTNIIQSGTRLQQPTLGQPSIFPGSSAQNNSGIYGQSERIIGNACANCHMKVHGTNHPSGARLQR